MRFLSTHLSGLYRVEIEFQTDSRGSFGRSFCTAEFAAVGLPFEVAQSNVSMNTEPRTLRGLHYQVSPHAEIKLVRCTRGRIFDVVVDLREDKPTHKEWFGTELSPDLPQMLLIPEGLAHGFITLEPQSEVTYLMSTCYNPDAARGVRWDDPAFEIEWPAKPRHMSSRDAGYPNYFGNVRA